jgi:prevent-host-death family protein
VSRARYSHRPVAITKHGKPSVAIINIDDLADLEDRAALAADYAAQLAGRGGVPLADWIPPWTRWTPTTLYEPDRRRAGDRATRHGKLSRHHAAHPVR